MENVGAVCDRIKWKIEKQKHYSDEAVAKVTNSANGKK